MRKESGFEVADKIKLYVANNDMLIDIINRNKEVIKGETLTEEILVNVEADYKEVVVNGESLNMTVEVIK